MTPTIAIMEKCLAIAQQAETRLLACIHLMQNSAELLSKDLRVRCRLEADLSAALHELQGTRQALMDSRMRERRAARCASIDALTGLPNRTSFKDRFSRALATHEPQTREFSVMFIDLDNFKAINDLHGHEVGDELLKVVGSRLERAVRPQDSISRQGGDEFLCLLQDVQGEQQVAAIASKLFDVVSAPCRLGALSLCVEPSIGIALYPRDATTIDGLLRGADRAMYWAKRQRLGHAFVRQLPASQGADVQMLSAPAAPAASVDGAAAESSARAGAWAGVPATTGHTA